MNRDAAETIALQAAAFIFADDQARDGFLALTGAALEDVRDRLTGPDMQSGILEFLMMDEQRLLEFCEAEGLAPELPGQARWELSGERFE